MANKKQLQKTFEELESIKKQLIEDIFPSIKQTKSELDQYQSDLLVDGENESIKTKILNLENKIVSLKENAELKVSEILDYHAEIFDGTEDEDPIKDKIESFLSDSEELFTDTDSKKKDLDVFYEKVFGKKDEEGEIKGGLEKEIIKYETRYKTLFDKIESLLPGATTAGLAKVFSDKVTEYKKEVSVWKWISFGLLVILTLYYICIPLKANTLDETFMGLLNRLPFIIFAVWLVVFAGNRRAESKKLEESYKHKEVMARSFVGYKEQIEELEESETDKVLLKSHMENLLMAINHNSGDFLDKTGDKSPLHDALDSAKGLLKKKSEILPIKLNE